MRQMTPEEQAARDASKKKAAEKEASEDFDAVETPVSGKNAIVKDGRFSGESAAKWATGIAAVEHINDMFKPETNTFQATGKGPGDVTIQNQHGSTLNNAISGAQNRDTPESRAARVNQTSIGNVLSGQVRQDQAGLTDALQDRAFGKKPSLAEMQMKAGLDASIQAQKSQALSARGMSPGMAARMAAQGIQQAQSDVTRDTAMLRAAEQERAEAALGQHLGNMRAQDLGYETAQAGLTNQANLLQAQLNQQTNLANQGAEFTNRAQMDAALANYMQMGMSREEAQARLNAEMAAARSAAQMQAQQINAATAEANTQRKQEAGGGLVGAVGNVIGGIFSDARLKTDVKKADVTSFLDSMEQRSPVVRGDQVTLQKQKLEEPFELPQKKEDKKKSLIGKIFEGFSQYSDERLKKDAQPSSDEVEQFLAALEGKTYRYKDEENHGAGEKLGVMAQDVRKGGPIGKALVEETKDGKLVIATGDQGVGAMLAGLGNLHKRIKELEAHG
jgi:hypothetical protein